MSSREGSLAGSLIEPLTRRERQILSLLAQGMSAPEIATHLILATSSVKWHIRQIYGKLGVNNKQKALVRAAEIGLLTAPAAAAVPPADSPPIPTSLLPHTTVRPRSTPTNNLPLQLTHFIGRAEQLAEVRRLLAAGRLLTLTGPGGTGKTRLSLQLAMEMLDQMPGGAWLVEFAPLSDAGLVAQTVAATLGLREEADEPALATLTRFFQGQQALLVLDNCEHLVDACAALAEALLRACPHLRVLATSREALGIAGEAVWPVPGLEVPPPATADERVADYAAVQLFVERAEAVRPGFAVTAQNAASLAQVCRRLDGLPLAIELAAARAALLPVEQIAALLDDAFRLLTGGSRTGWPRHKTLRATVDWSYQLLDESERRLLRRLAVFTGGWSLEAAQAVGADAEAAGSEGTAWTVLASNDVLDVLTRLAAKSLVISDATQGVEARFHMLETIREYAQAKLDESGEATAVRERHLAYFLALAERAEPEMRGREQLAWFDRLEAEHDNLRRALEQATRGPDLELGLRLASALHYFWDVRGNWLEGTTWFNRLLAGNPAPKPSVAWVLGLALAARFSDGWDIGVARSQASLALARTLGAAGQASAAYALRELGWHIQRQDHAKAVALQQESLALFEQAGDDWGRATVLRNIGSVAQQSGDYQRAIGAYEQSQALFERLGDMAGVVRALKGLAGIAAWQGDHQRASELCEAVLALCRRLRDWGSYADTLFDVARALRSLGRLEQATAYMREGLALLRGLGGSVNSGLLNELAYEAITRGDFANAGEFALAIQNQSSSKLNQAWGGIYLGQIAYLQGQMLEAQAHFLAAWNIYKELDDGGWSIVGVAWVLPWLARVAYRQNKLEQARSLLHEVKAIEDPASDYGDIRFAQFIWAEVARAQGEPAVAAEYYTRSLKLLLKDHLPAEVPDRLEGFAKLASAAGQGQRAARLFGAAAAMRERTRTPISPVERAEYDTAVALAQSQLDPAAFEAAWADGLAMDYERAAVYALEN